MVSKERIICPQCGWGSRIGVHRSKEKKLKCYHCGFVGPEEKFFIDRRKKQQAAIKKRRRLNDLVTNLLKEKKEKKEKKIPKLRRSNVKY